MMSGHLKNTRIGKELMKTSRTELGIALVIAMASIPLAGCGKPEPSPTAAAQPAAAKPAAAADKAHEKPGEHKEGEAGHGEEESLKLSAEAIEAAGIKVEELAAQEIS